VKLTHSLLFTGIRSALLESEEHECPDCKDKGVSPDTLLPNRFLRSAVAKFRNDTGYIKSLRPILMPEPERMPSPVKKEETLRERPQEREDDQLSRESISPENNLDELSRSPPPRRPYVREDTPTHDELPHASEHLPPHMPPHMMDVGIPPPSSYLAPPGVDDHFVPSYPPPPVPPSGPPPPSNYGPGPRPYRGQYYGGGGGGGRREPEFGYHFDRPDRRPFRNQRYVFCYDLTGMMKNFGSFPC